MSNPIQTFSRDIWNLILDNCSNLDSLIQLSKANKQIRELALSKLENIKTNINELYTSFYKIQDLYKIKYQNIRPNIDITNLGKYILLELNIKNGLVCCDNQKIINNELMNLENNQIMVSPIFGKLETLRFLPENNPNPLFGIGIYSQTYSIAQDRLLIKKITIKSKMANPHLLIAIKLAEDKANKQFYKLNGSYTDAVKNILFYQ